MATWTEAHTSCTKCHKSIVEAGVLVNGRCTACNPFRACPRAGCLGDLESRPRPDWMNRFVCNRCGKAVSK